MDIFIADKDVMPMKTLLGLSGKEVNGSMKKQGLSEIENVCIGKHTILKIETAGKKLLQPKKPVKITLQSNHGVLRIHN
jgi:hypothetical protein